MTTVLSNYQAFHDWRVALYQALNDSSVDTNYLDALIGDLYQTIERLEEKKNTLKAKREVQTE